MQQAGGETPLDRPIKRSRRPDQPGPWEGRTAERRKANRQRHRVHPATGVFRRVALTQVAELPPPGVRAERGLNVAATVSARALESTR